MRIGVIAGSTRGIGFALVRALAERWGSEGRVVLTARSTEDGERAVEQLRPLHVEWMPFDLSDPASASKLAGALMERHGRLDVAVLNGAYMPRSGAPASADARPMIEANNHGTLRFLRAFAPVLGDEARLVVVASGLGTLANLQEHLRPLFNARTKSADEINAMMDVYVAAAEAGTATAAGWPEWVNIPSKVGQVAVTRAFAFHEFNRQSQPGVLINAACPGLTVTDGVRELLDTVFKGREAQTPEQAAARLLRLITLPPGTRAPYGELVRHGKVLPFGD